MRKQKFTLSLITLVMTASLATSATCFAGWFDKKDSKLQSSFEACKGIEITVDEEKSKNICHECTKQYAPKIGIMGGSLEKFVSHQQMVNFLNMVGAKVIENLDKQVAHADAMIGCYQKGSKKGCRERIAALDSKLQDIAMEALPRRSFPPIAKDWPEENKLFYQKSIEMTAKAKAKSGCTPGQISMQPRTCEGNGRVVLDKEFVQKKTRTPVSFFMDQLVRYHHGRFNFVNKDLIKAHQEMKKSAQKQIAAIRESIKNGDLEFDKGMRTERLKSAALGKYDLLDLVAFQPVVNELLKTQKGYCGLATAIADRHAKRDVQNDLMAAGAMMGLGLTGGAAVGAAAGLTGAGMQGLYIAGIALGSGFWGDAGMELSRTKESAKFDLKTQEQVKQKQNEFNLAALTHPLDFFGASAVGKSLVKTMNKSFAKSAKNFADSPVAAKQFDDLAKKAFAKGKAVPKKDLAKTNQKALVAAAAKESGLADDEAKIVAECMSGGAVAICQRARVLLDKMGVKDIDYMAYAGKSIDPKQVKQIQSAYKEQLTQLRDALAVEDPKFKFLVDENPAEADKFLVATIDNMEAQGLKKAEVKAKIHKALNECAYVAK